MEYIPLPILLGDRPEGGEGQGHLFWGFGLVVGDKKGAQVPSARSLDAANLCKIKHIVCLLFIYIFSA